MEHNAFALIEAARTHNVLLTTAESCTAGLIAAALTDVSGSSDVFMQSMVTYANQSKAALLGVEEAMLEKYGAVSIEVARAMADGATTKLHDVFPAHTGHFLSAAVTGVAGPTGGTEDKPVGLVYIASCLLHHNQLHTLHEKHLFKGDRGEVRHQTVEAALHLMLRMLALL